VSHRIPSPPPNNNRHPAAASSSSGASGKGRKKRRNSVCFCCCVGLVTQHGRGAEGEKLCGKIKCFKLKDVFMENTRRYKISPLSHPNLMEKMFLEKKKKKFFGEKKRKEKI
jgi:hypothetical protein